MYTILPKRQSFRQQEQARMHQPIWVLRSGNHPVDALCAEILRSEGLPWFDTQPLDDFREAPPEVKLLIVVGQPLSPASIERLARAIASGTTLIAVTPDEGLAAALGITLAAPIRDGSVSVTTLPGW